MSSPHTVTATPTDELHHPSVGRRMRKALPIYAALSPYFFFFLVFAAIPMIFTPVSYTHLTLPTKRIV